MNDDIYLDKIKLGAVVVQKELELINLCNQIITDLRQGVIDRPRLLLYPTYNWAWQNLAELFDFLKHDYLSKIDKADRKKLNDIMKNYNSLGMLNLKDLLEAKEIILEVMAKARFHDIVRKAEYTHGLDILKDKYGIKE